MRATGTHNRRHPFVGVVVLVALAVAVVACGGDDVTSDTTGPAGGVAEGLAFEAVGSTSEDAFTDSVAITETAEFPDALTSTVDATLTTATADPSTGGITTTGGTPGLYGGSGDTAVCDVPALTGYLTDPANAVKAAAWAGALGITPDAIADRLATFTPVVLTVDTLVTNHGFRDGTANALPAVLQAGTAVLVDQTGVPRVKCGCGNPLGPPPTDTQLPPSTDVWDGYDPTTTATVTPAEAPVEALTLVDTTTGDTYQHDTGSDPTTATTALPPLLARVALGNGDLYEVALYASDDGDEWEQVHTFAAGQTIRDLAIGDEVAVAVGFDEAGTGRAYTSTDAVEWDGPHPTPVAFGSVTFHDDTWFALAGVGEVQADAAVFTSTDGVTWEQLGTLPAGGPDDIWQSITSTPDVLVVTRSAGASSVTFTSPDGATWTEGTAVPVGALQVAHDGSTFAGLGLTSPDGPEGFPVPMQNAVLSDDGLSWTAPTPVDTTSDNPDDLDRFPEGLAAFDGGWIAHDIICPDLEEICDDGVQIVTSTDLVSWTGRGTIGGVVEGLAVAA